MDGFERLDGASSLQFVAETVALAMNFVVFVICDSSDADKFNSRAEEIISAGGYAWRTPAGNWWSWCST